MEKRLYLFENKGAARFMKKDGKAYRVGRLALSMKDDGSDLPPPIGSKKVKGDWELMQHEVVDWSDDEWNATATIGPKVWEQYDEIKGDVVFVYWANGGPTHEVKADGSSVCWWKVAFSRDVEAELPSWFAHGGALFADAMNHTRWDMAKIREDLEKAPYVWGRYEVHFPKEEREALKKAERPEEKPQGTSEEVLARIYKKSPPT